MASVSNGNGERVPLHLEKRDKLFLGILGALMSTVVPLSLYVFQTNADALAETAVRVAVEQKIITDAAVHERESEMRLYYEGETDNARDKQIKTLGEGISAIHANQQRRMIEDGYRKREIDPLPAGISFDDIDSITNP